MKKFIFFILVTIPLSLLAQNGIPSKIDEFKAEKEFLKGLEQYERENYRASIDYFNQALRLDVNHRKAHELLGEAYFKMGDYNAAIENYQMASQKDPENAELRNSMGVAAAYLKQYRAAAAYFYEALRIDPNHKGAQTNLRIANQRLEEIGEDPFQEEDYIPPTWVNDDWNKTQPDEWDYEDDNPDNPLIVDNPLLQDNNDPDLETKPLVRTYDKSEIKVGDQNDPYITIERIKFTENSTRITFVVRNISEEVFPIELDRRNGSNAFYLTDRGFQKIYKLKKIYSLDGWPQKPYPLRPNENNKMFTAEFDRLDDEVETFHILEGKSDRKYTWDFWDVEFQEMP
jgi:tetratricopeptide (TPR) repeat protein